MQLRLYGLFYLGFAKTKLHVCDFEISLKGLRFPLAVDLYAVACTHQFFIVDLVPVDAHRVRRYSNLSNLIGVTHKSFKSLQNIVRVFLLYLEVLDWKPKHFCQLRPNSKSAKSIFLRFSIGQVYSSIGRTSQNLSFFFL